jgi:hypothetical protein
MKQENFEKMSTHALLWARRVDRAGAWAARGLKHAGAWAIRRRRVAKPLLLAAAAVVAGGAAAITLLLPLAGAGVWLVAVLSSSAPVPQVTGAELAATATVALLLLAAVWRLLRPRRPAPVVVAAAPSAMPALLLARPSSHAVMGLWLVATVAVTMAVHVATLPPEPQAAGLEVLGLYAAAAALWAGVYRKPLGFLWGLAAAAPLLAAGLWLVQVVAVSVYKHTLALRGQFASTATSWQGYLADGQTALMWLAAGAAASGSLLWLHHWRQRRQ